MKLLDRMGLALTVSRRLAVHDSARWGVSLLPLARFAAWQLRKRVSPRPVDRRVFGGGQLRCYPDAHASNAVIYHGWPDWSEMRLVAALLRPGDVFIDVGANVGVYSVLAATRVLPGGRVIAIEPEASIVSRLRENFRLNGLDERDIHAVALGETTGVMRFDTGKDCTGRVLPEEVAGGVELPVRRLDDLVEGDLEPVAIAKVDVEGFELQALRGAARLLAAHRPRCWLLETNPSCLEYGTTRRELHELLAATGHQLAAVESGGRVLRRLPLGGPYPHNALAFSDAAWLLARIPELVIV